MSNRIKFKIKKAINVFPAKYTKVRLEDLSNLTISKGEYLTNREKEKLQGFAHSEFFFKRQHFEFIIERKGNQIILIPIDEE